MGITKSNNIMKMFCSVANLQIKKPSIYHVLITWYSRRHHHIIRHYLIFRATVRLVITLEVSSAYINSVITYYSES